MTSGLKQKSILIFLVMMAAFLASFEVVAQTSEGIDEAKQSKGAAREGGKKRAEVSFEDELVQGEVKKPELFYLLQKKQFNYKRLLRLRENFIPEMKRTATDIQRSGSVD